MLALSTGAMAWCIASFALAGIVKGVTGIGIPLVSISLLTFVLSLPEAVVLLPMPIILSNIWQSISGGYMTRTFRRFALALVAVAIGTFIGAGLLTSVSQLALLLVLGSVLATLAIVSLFDLEPRIPARHEAWAGALCGSAGGVLNGMSAMVGPPIIMLLVSLRLGKDEFVGTISTIYLVAGVIMTVALASYDALDLTGIGWSTAAAVPLFVGMFAGQWLRQRVSEAQFRKALLIVVLLMGLNLIRRALTG